MPEISRFFGIIIAMYYNEHNPPHFHIKYGEFEAIMTIETLQISEGLVPNRVKLLVLEWADEHRLELFEDWELAKQKEELKKINPLK